MEPMKQHTDLGRENGGNLFKIYAGVDGDLMEHDEDDTLKSNTLPALENCTIHLESSFHLLATDKVCLILE